MLVVGRLAAAALGLLARSRLFAVVPPFWALLSLPLQLLVTVVDLPLAVVLLLLLLPVLVLLGLLGLLVMLLRLLHELQIQLTPLDLALVALKVALLADFDREQWEWPQLLLRWPAPQSVHSDLPLSKLAGSWGLPRPQLVAAVPLLSTHRRRSLCSGYPGTGTQPPHAAAGAPVLAWPRLAAAKAAPCAATSLAAACSAWRSRPWLKAFRSKRNAGGNV